MPTVGVLVLLGDVLGPAHPLLDDLLGHLDPLLEDLLGVPDPLLDDLLGHLDPLFDGLLDPFRLLVDERSSLVGGRLVGLAAPDPVEHVPQLFVAGPAGLGAEVVAGAEAEEEAESEAHGVVVTRPAGRQPPPVIRRRAPGRPGR